MENLKEIVFLIVFLPLLGSIIAGLFGFLFSRKTIHILLISFLGISFLLSIYLFNVFSNLDNTRIEDSFYTWAFFSSLKLEIGFLIDRLTVFMISVVTSISFLVHIYTVGYMSNDDGYKRFFSYISFFTFSMLMLVISNNFLQLFFGWESVGLASYLLIGFWYKRNSAVFANLKAFIVNRIGDLGFLIGIAAVFYYFGSLNYIEVFNKINFVAEADYNIYILNFKCSAVTFISIFLFIGAMGKSAQIPLHVWLPDSMEGPTPISALIHAATMVTAGVFMIVRMSPIIEYSQTALIFIMFVGSLTCLFMGVLGIVQDDIKRIVAYSTLSQLGLMVAGLGASCYAFSMYHLMTHAFFKALLFLGSGSVIIAMHHEQNIMKMGNLWKKIPITYICMLIGSLSLMGVPGFSGFYSKDLIIESIKFSVTPYSHLAYYMVLFSIFFTAFYSCRLLIIVFHKCNLTTNNNIHHLEHVDTTVYVPLIILAVPSIFIGFIFHSNIINNYFQLSIFVSKINDVYYNIHMNNALHMLSHGLISMPFVLIILGSFSAVYCYLINIRILNFFKNNFSFIYKLLLNNYLFDLFNQNIIVFMIKKLSFYLWQIGDILLIDSLFVNGAAKLVNLFSNLIREIQTGFLYHYVFFMVSGLFLLVLWLVV